MSQAPRELAMSQGANKPGSQQGAREAVMSHTGSNEPGTP